MPRQRLTKLQRKNLAGMVEDAVLGDPGEVVDQIYYEYFDILDLVYIEFADYIRWYSFLLGLYESTDLFEDKQGFTVENVVTSGDSYTYSWDLQPYNLACLCPTYTSGTTNPQDCKLNVVIQAYPPPTMKVRTVTTPAPMQVMPHIDNMPSLPQGFYYTIAPKASGVHTFYNNDTTGLYDAYCVFHSDFLPMEVESARKLIYLVRNPLIERICGYCERM